MNKDQVTTLLGVVGAGIIAVNPVLGAVATQSLHTQDWVSLGSSLVFGLLGYFSNKK